MTQCTQCLHGAKIQMIIVTVTYPQDEEANKELSGSPEIQFLVAGVRHFCYNFYLY